MLCFVFFFFKQKTAYEMRISDWSSDVCSSDLLKVEIESLDDCPSYAGRIISKINPKARTPDWMRERLRRAGIRSIQAIVDITNYVMLELGQPMHAFDADKLAGNIRVRSEEPTSELQSLLRISYAVFCLKNKTH